MGKKVKRKNSDIIWEVWHEDSEILQLMGYNTTNNRSICITRSMFERDWEVVSFSETCRYCFYCERKINLEGHFDVGDDFEGIFECVEERDNNIELRNFIARNKK